MPGILDKNKVLPDSKEAQVIALLGSVADQANEIDLVPLPAPLACLPQRNPMLRSVQPTIAAAALLQASHLLAQALLGHCMLRELRGEVEPSQSPVLKAAAWVREAQKHDGRHSLQQLVEAATATEEVRRQPFLQRSST